MKAIILLLSAVFVVSAKAKSTSEECPPTREEKYGTIVIRNFYPDTGICSIGVSPSDAWQSLTYRDYSIASSGLFMVFNAYGSSGSFGVRDFMLFPRVREHVSFKWNDARSELQVTGVTNDVYTFDAKTAQLKSISGARKVTVGPVSENNRAGVEIQGYKGQLLDIGYAAGSDPSQDKGGIAKYIQNGSSCGVKNAVLFNYLSNGDIQFKFDSDKGFKAAIRSYCR